MQLIYNILPVDFTPDYCFDIYLLFMNKRQLVYKNVFVYTCI